MKLGEIVRALRTETGWGTPELAKRASEHGPKVAYQKIQQLEGKPDTSPGYLPQLAMAFGKSIDDLLSWRPGMSAIGPNNAHNDSFVAVESHGVSRFETGEGYVRFPLLEGFAGMGPGDYVADYPEVVESLRVAREWVERKLPGVPPEAIRVITGRGDSMKGQYNDGDLIFIDTRIKAFDQDSAYCFRWEGRVLVKRLQFVGRGMLRILSKNADYPAIDAPIDDIEIGGRALAAWTLKEF